MKGTQKHWRRLAQQSRMLASRIDDGETERILLSIAESYERLAEIADVTCSTSGDFQHSEVRPGWLISTRSITGNVALPIALEKGELR